MRPFDLCRQTARLATPLAFTLALAWLPNCNNQGGAPPPGGNSDGAGGSTLPPGAPDRVMLAGPGASFVGPLPAPGSNSAARPTGEARAPWSISFIGPSARQAPNPAAAVQASGAVFALFAGGHGLTIAGTEDDFLFLHRTLAGDGAVVALLRSVEGCPEGRVSFGPMIRAGTDPQDGYVMGAASGPARGTALQARSTQGLLASTLRLDASVGLPLWLKVERQGTRVTSGYSSDGQTWRQAESVVSDLGQQVEVGLAASSHRQEHCRGQFEAVEVIGAGN